jgi:Rrf2 family protein
MPSSTRFAAAAHLMVLLACERDKPQTSELLAKSLATNPAVVRRLLGALTRAGLASSRLGKGGGTRLAKGPKKITLADIYRAVETPGLIAMPRAAPDPSCPVAGGVQPVLCHIGAAAEAAFMAALDAVTLKQIAKEIAAQNAAAESAA